MHFCIEIQSVSISACARAPNVFFFEELNERDFLQLPQLPTLQVLVRFTEFPVGFLPLKIGFARGEGNASFAECKRCKWIDGNLR